MKKIENKRDYQIALEKIESLIVKVGDNQSYDNPDFIMLDRISNLVADYEDKYFKIDKPGLINVIKLRMYELGLKQNQLAELLGVPKTRVSEYLSGKRDITISVARKLNSELKIDGDIILQ